MIRIEKPHEFDDESLRAAARRTLQALRSGASVVYQAVVFDGRMLGYADFLIRDDTGAWRIEDTKLASTATLAARYQVAAYARILADLDVQLASQATIALGDGTEVAVDLDDILPTFDEHRARVERMIADHIASGRAAAFVPDVVHTCLECLACREAVEQARDVLLVDGVGRDERRSLHAAGIVTIDDLAAATAAPGPIAASSFERLRRRAALQLQSGALPNVPAFEVVRPELLGMLPKADPADLFLSFAAQGRSEQVAEDPDHLFTVMSVSGGLQTYWGEDRESEAQEFLRFLRDVDARRAEHPAMRIYHYSPVDRPHLTDLADRAGAGRAEVDALIEDGVLVDLFTHIDEPLLIGTRNRTLREVGRLADPDLAQRLSTADPAAQRAEYRRLAHQGDTTRAAALKSLLERENAERCALTKRLRDRLLDLLLELGITPGSVDVPRRRSRVASEVARALDAQATDGSPHALAVAALGYHPLEASVFWRAHQRRLHRHTSEWANRVRGAAQIDRLRIEQDWAKGARGGMTRTLRLQVTAAPGTTFAVGEQLFLVYDLPRVFEDPRASPGARTVTDAEIVEKAGEEVVVRERRPKGAGTWSALPAALAPGRPPRTSAIETAVERWAASLLRGDPPDDAVTDLVLRRPPRLRSGAIARRTGLDERLDVHASLLETIEQLDSSYVAMQGPPGSGKTTTGARVIAELVRRGWRIGVVAQSHAVVEHLLEQIVAHQAPVDRVAKAVQDDRARTFTVIGKDSLRTFMREHADGFVVGGTAWDFTNSRRAPQQPLDLLVIDEAGQFSLVNAIAVGQVARNLLLLGDPQQLPQVSQAVHRASADSSALGWLLDGAPTVPEAFGYFLDRTWRMHPALTRAVSDLSYDGRLGSHGPARARSLEDLQPGLRFRPVRHLARRDSAPEEANEIAAIVRQHIGRFWQESLATPRRPLTQADIIVVAPFNAQVETIRRVLATNGFSGVEVGTVDRFQGREAVIAVYSTTMSTLRLRPQAIGFVLGRNRLNVAISRAQWAAYIVHSPSLTDVNPRNAADAAALSRFLRLMEFSTDRPAAPRSRPDEPRAS